MTEQHSAGSGRKAASSSRPKSETALKAAVHETLVASGFKQGADGAYTAPDTFGTRGTSNAADGTAGSDDGGLPRDHNRVAQIDDRLRLLIERIERLEDEKKGIGDDIKDVYNEGKAVGYDKKIMRLVVKLRKMKPDDRREAEILIETYCAALGMDAQPLLL